MRRSRRSTSSRPLRPMDWVASSFECGVYASMPRCSAQALWAVPPSVLQSEFTDPTLMVSRLRIGAAVRTVGSFSQNLGVLHFGLITWDDVNDIVPADFPNPFDHGYLDWIGTGFVPITQHSTNTTQDSYGFSTSEDGSGFIKWPAKRRLGNGKGIMLCAKWISGSSGSADLKWDYYYRGLIKE